MFLNVALSLLTLQKYYVAMPYRGRGFKKYRDFNFYAICFV